MRKLLLILFVSFLFCISFSQSVSADVPYPDYYKATCNPGEREVKCAYKSDEPFGPKTYNECKSYENNPDYRYLNSEGHSFGGTEKYCYKAVLNTGFILLNIERLLPLLFITLVIEVFIFSLMISKKNKALLYVAFVNVVTVSLLYVFTTTMTHGGLSVILVAELVVIYIEAILIKRFLKKVGFIKILKYSFVANATSAILGTLILNVLGGM